jgi:hypothetical protein
VTTSGDADAEAFFALRTVQSRTQSGTAGQKLSKLELVGSSDQ